MELGELDAALTHLERAIEGRDPSLVDLAVAPQWDALRAHPGFQRCLASMGLAALQA
jgi:glutathione S-transferase